MIFQDVCPFDKNQRCGCPRSRRVCETWDWCCPLTCSSVTDNSFQFSYPGSMPQALHRFYGAGDLHFITFSCYQRQPLLDSEIRRDLFLRILERVRRRYRLVILAYVVMPEHIHLLLSEPQRATLSTVIQALKLGFVRSLFGSPSLCRGAPDLAALARPGNQRFWQARFYDFNVWTERKRVEKLRYMHRNPVKRGLVDSPEKWRWSSFRWYSCGEVGPVRINDTEILLLRMRPRTA